MKRILTTLLTLCLLFSSLPQLALAEEEFSVLAKHAIAVEASTGKILYEHDADTKAGIASITKILTVYMVYKAIDEGKLRWNTPVSISDYPYELTTVSLASNVPLEKRKYTVKQLVEASMIASANSAAIALAEKIAGSEPKFVDMMIKQLKDWGIKDAKLVNASGLNNSLLLGNIYPGSNEDDENLLSARDVAIIARHLIQDYPEVLTITSKTSADFDGTTMTTFNYMLPSLPYYHEGVDGLKTGTTSLAGACFVGTSLENGMRVITVVLNAEHSEENPNERFEVTERILNYVRNNFELTTIMEAGKTYKKARLTIADADTPTINAVTKNDFKVVQRKASNQNNNIRVTSNPETLYAPLKKDQAIGQVEFLDKDIIGSGYLEALPSAQLVAEKDQPSSFFLRVWWNHFVTYVNTYL